MSYTAIWHVSHKSKVLPLTFNSLVFPLSLGVNLAIVLLFDQFWKKFEEVEICLCISFWLMLCKSLLNPMFTSQNYCQQGKSPSPLSFVIRNLHTWLFHVRFSILRELWGRYRPGLRQLRPIRWLQRKWHRHGRGNALSGGPRYRNPKIVADFG